MLAHRDERLAVGGDGDGVDGARRSDAEGAHQCRMGEVADVPEMGGPVRIAGRQKLSTRAERDGVDQLRAVRGDGPEEVRLGPLCDVEESASAPFPPTESARPSGENANAAACSIPCAMLVVVRFSTCEPVRSHSVVGAERDGPRPSRVGSCHIGEPSRASGSLAPLTHPLLVPVATIRPSGENATLTTLSASSSNAAANAATAVRIGEAAVRIRSTRSARVSFDASPRASTSSTSTSPTLSQPRSTPRRRYARRPRARKSPVFVGPLGSAALGGAEHGPGEKRARWAGRTRPVADRLVVPPGSGTRSLDHDKLSRRFQPSENPDESSSRR